MDVNEIKIRIKDFWKKYEVKIVLAAGFCLISALSFEAGMLMRNDAQNQPVVIEKPVTTLVAGTADQNPPEAQKLASKEENKPLDANHTRENCVFMGSKNSDKYHLPTCSYAKRIKPENIVCFKDENEAKSKGYSPDGNCIK